MGRDPRFDLHASIELTERGCPPELAIRILAPLDETETSPSAIARVQPPRPGPRIVRCRIDCSRRVPRSASVKITDVEPIVLRLSRVDTTRADGTQDAFLVRVHTDEGIVGIGEADTSPYLARTIVEMPSSHSIARGLREVLVGEDPLQIDRLWQLMFHASDHYGRAGAALHTISAIDIALWDIAGKAAGRPVCDLLGGRRVTDVPVYASEVMPDSVDEVRRLAERAARGGYPALKLGWGPLGQDVDHDVALVRAARETLGPASTLMLDGGRAYSVKSALQLLDRVEEHDLYWFEEALAPDDLDGYRRLSDATTMRIAAGEADATLPPFRALVEHGHVDVLQPDLARCGGFTVARQIALLERDLRRSDRSALLLDGRAGRRVASLRGDARQADMVRVLRCRLDPRQRNPA